MYLCLSDYFEWLLRVIIIQFYLSGKYGTGTYQQHRGQEQPIFHTRPFLFRYHLWVFQRPSRHIRLENYLHWFTQQSRLWSNYWFLWYGKSSSRGHAIQCGIKSSKFYTNFTRWNHRYYWSYSGTTAIIISVSYEKQEFFRCGYYVRNEYD